ncbi:DoxX family protein [Telluribacter sp.]|jgi:uncharacterized membrane protein YphA (DoxX/SURF4 family)|uniref:DoxX family protein n=1 Tax=Telluribacter sp. TaxID=1978767 RepID=UPI002E117D4E|nr:DoxX family protein [Telluribacter sp.]
MNIYYPHQPENIMLLFNKVNEAKLVAWRARNGLKILRISLGVLFLWFGLLKFFPGLSPAEMLAGRTIHVLTLGRVEPEISMPLLAIWEGLIGLGLIFNYQIRITLLLLYFQMIGTFLPIIFFNNETWTSNVLVPTLLGQYIIKNIILISAAIVIGATSSGGALIYDPIIAKRAQYLELLYERFRRRFKKEPVEKKSGRQEL